MNIILASQSRARQTMLTSAGLNFKSIPADLDEQIILKAGQNQGQSPKDIAQSLADAKALYVSKTHPDALIIGADQILEIEGQLLSKAENKNQAREKLKTLRDKTHHLISSVSVAQNNKILWQNTGFAYLKMFNFTDEFLDSYIERAGQALTRSVGAYELESLGAQLFESIEGDYFTILGLPLLPLLTYLRQEQGAGL